MPIKGLPTSLIIILVIGFQIIRLSSQTNPFEIRALSPISDSISKIEQTSGDLSGQNPFNLKPGVPRQSIWEYDTKKKEVLGWINQADTSKAQFSEVQSLLFWSLLFLSFLLAIALNINRSVTLKLYRSLINLNFLSLLYRESKEENRLIYYLLYGLYFIGLSLFIYLSILQFKGLKSPVYILYISAFVVLVYALRHLSLKLIGSIYGVYKEADRYLFSIVISSCIMSIILIPADFIITFVNPELGRKCIWLIFIIFIILYLYRQFREIIFSVNLWRQHIFHFLLYLCTFEIAPVVLCIVFLSRQGVI